MVVIEIALQMLAEVITVLIALAGNLFIVYVYFLEFRKTKALQPNELLVTVLALFNILVQFSLVLWFMLYLFNLCTYFGGVIYKVTDFNIIFFSKSSYWFTAWLCFFYCMKIIKVKRMFFIRLKQRMSLLVKILILCTMMLNFSLAYPVVFLIKLKANSTSISILCKDYYITGDTTHIYGASLSFLTSLSPLAVMLVSSMGIVIFLCLHSRNMKRNAIAGNSSHGNTHTAVAVMIICLILLYMLCTITVLSANLQVALAQFDTLVAITFTSSLYSAGSSLILITGTVKLRQSCVTLFCSCRQQQ
uniref:Taste receptor type 2 n=1 Tax=Latimeria chalumnae TaxID=7897 RepID=H2ZXH4_LATCH|nr:PREDICTED: taste receptor type 2 member 1-like [Latimeria chalumnae]|eukprot:XP_006013570.1 PREDICTED: taste receptor type 2 member 1-like [Latimeria chalumnae]